MNEAEEKSIAVELALLRHKMDSVNEKMGTIALELKKLEEQQNSMNKRADVFEGGLSWLYKTIFVVTALIGAVLAILEL